MNRRQRKKKNKAQQITLVVGCAYLHKAEEYEKMRRSIDYQLKAGSVIVLPAYLHVEAIIQQNGGRRIEIRREMKDNVRSDGK